MFSEKHFGFAEVSHFPTFDIYVFLNSMNQVEMNKQAKLSEHLASPSVAALSHSSELNGLRLSPHFSLGELTRSKSHPEIYNVPSHVHIENLKRVCVWLEALRERYNERYVLSEKSPTGARPQGAVSVPGDAGGQVPKVEVFGENFISRPDPEVISRPDPEEPIVITSGYRSAELNRKVGGVATSNHLTGCAVDIRVAGKEQLIRYACILLDYADETKLDFDELLLEHGANGVIWLHFAVRAPTEPNRRKINFLKG